MVALFRTGIRRGNEEPQEVLSPEEARQGPPGRPVLWVLIGGLVLVTIGFALTFGWALVTDVTSPPTPG